MENQAVKISEVPHGEEPQNIEPQRSQPQKEPSEKKKRTPNEWVLEKGS